MVLLIPHSFLSALAILLNCHFLHQDFKIHLRWQWTRRGNKDNIKKKKKNNTRLPVHLCRRNLSPSVLQAPSKPSALPTTQASGLVSYSQLQACGREGQGRRARTPAVSHQEAGSILVRTARKGGFLARFLCFNTSQQSWSLQVNESILLNHTLILADLYDYV